LAQRLSLLLKSVMQLIPHGTLISRLNIRVK
jgi:hypothetical protein